MSRVVERRHRAQCAAHAAWEPRGDAASIQIDVAILTATRVKITDEAESAACREYVNGIDARNDGDMRGAIKAALIELGFEVEE